MRFKKILNRRIWRLCSILFAIVAINTTTVNAQTVQEHVHHMSHTVMPFSMTQSLHIFKMTETGGIQKVISREGDTEQAKLIRQHLRHLAHQFQQGNYSDPATLHGETMPGLKELSTGANGIQVSYAEITDGAQLSFTTQDISLLTAIHRWFGAQLSEHGADAKAE